MLEINNISCGYDGKAVVKNFSLTVSSGEIVSVTGPNGCGKTTLLRALCGIIPLRSGKILLDGKDIGELKRHELSMKTALLSQSGAGGEYADFTVYDTVMLGRYAHSKGSFGGDGEKDRAVVEDCLERTGTADIRSKMITELSGGQLQRVFLARTFAQEPDVILLDEPANHLDIKYQLTLIKMLEDWAKSGRTVIGVFHDLSLATALSDRLVLMCDGEIAACGETKEICRSEKMSEVYGFDVKAYMQRTLGFWND